MGEFWTAIAAGVAVSAWNKFVMNGWWWQRRFCEDPRPEETEEECASSTSSAISVDVHCHT